MLHRIWYVRLDSKYSFESSLFGRRRQGRRLIFVFIFGSNFSYLFFICDSSPWKVLEKLAPFLLLISTFFALSQIKKILDTAILIRYILKQWQTSNFYDCLKLKNSALKFGQEILLIYGQQFAEAVIQTCPVKNVFLKISQNSQENNWARVLFLVNFVKFLTAGGCFWICDNFQTGFAYVEWVILFFFFIFLFFFFRSNF